MNQIEMINTGELLVYARNSRTHSAEQIAQLAASIEEFGFTNPVLIDANNEIIAGHGRVMAAQILEMEQVECVRLTHLTHAQQRAYVIADNQLALNAGWDMDILKSEVESLDLIDFDIDVMGFDDQFINDLLGNNKPPDGLVDDDAIPDKVSDTITNRGDIWCLGEHRLLCGDSTNNNEVNELLAGETYDVCIFDPPYDLEYLYKSAMPPMRPGAKLVVMWDFKRFALGPMSAVNAGWTPLYEFIWDNVQSWYTPNRPLARHKSIGIFGDDPFFDTDKGIIFDGKERKAHKVTNTRGECDYIPLDGAKHIATVEAFSNVRQTDDHGHGKPIPWLQAIYAGIGGDNYLDLFGGSGASLIVCEKLNKKCFMMELDPGYCDVIVGRWEGFTGNQAVLLSKNTVD